MQGQPSCESGLSADAPSAEKDSSSSFLTLPSVAERSLVEAVHALVLQLAESNQILTHALLRLTETAQQTALALEELTQLLQQEQEQEEEALTYLDGSPR